MFKLSDPLGNLAVVTTRRESPKETRVRALRRRRAPDMYLNIDIRDQNNSILGQVTLRSGRCRATRKHTRRRPYMGRFGGGVERR